jgi:hypothetical protein
MIINVPLVTVPNLAANSTASQVITVQGLLPGDVITWNQQSVVAGISVENAFVSAINTLTMLWSNTTVAAVNGTAPQSFLFIVQRPEMSGGVSSLPSAVV